jgi:putative hydrolase of the HAD superfamily
MFQGFIFDFDNTIYDYNKCNNLGLLKTFNYIEKKYSVDKNYINKIYEELNKKIKEDNNYSNKFNKNIYFKRLVENLNINLEEIGELLKIYNDEFYKNIVIYDDLIDLLKLLKSKEIKICILSNNNFKQQYDKLVYLKMIKYIDIIQTSDEIGNEKPNKLIYLSIINKMKLNSENIAMIGDNFYHDIEPSIDLGLIPFYFNNKEKEFVLKDKYFEFGNYRQIIDFLVNYYMSVNNLIYLSKLFAQSTLNIQGQGGNISVKTFENKIMLIKSSGTILGNMNEKSGFCITDNIKCNDIFKNNKENELIKTKIFGYGNPSMETFFHCFMKKYTVHLHFTLSNIFLCCNELNILNNINIKHKIIDYFIPGINLATEIYLNYDVDTDIYFLKNHGLIITSDNINHIENMYLKIFYFFDYSNLYKTEINAFMINKYIYEKYNKSIVCKNYSINDILKIKNMKYCFPDLAVYYQEIITIKDYTDINFIKKIPDLIIYDNNVYIVADNISKMHSMIEILDEYIILCKKYDKLEIVDNNIIKNMEQEKYRKNN